MQIYIVIPAYNEEKRIGAVVRDVRKKKYRHIIVVDDGSQDKTSEIAKHAGALVVRHAVNRGKGAAVKTGIMAAKHKGATIVVTLDADGQHNPQDIAKCVAPLMKKFDVVLGSRFLKKNEIPFSRWISNKIANVITTIVCGVAVSDSQCGLRGYGERALLRLNFLGDRYDFDSEVLRGIRQARLRFTEVPIDVRYTRYSMQKTTRQSWGSGVTTFIALLQRT